MRILYVTEFFPETEELLFTGGIESLVYHLVKELRHRHQITVLYRPQRKQPIQVFPEVEFISCGPVTQDAAASVRSLAGRAAYFLQAITKIPSSKFDLVIGTNFTSYIPAYLLSNRFKTPAVAIYADLLLGQWKQHFPFPINVFGELSERLMLKLRWNAYMPISHATGKKLINAGISPSKIIPSPLGVDVQSLQPSHTVNRTIDIVAISRLVSYKRLQDLIEAIQLLKLNKQKAEISCHIIGSGPYKAQLESLIHKYNLEKNIQLLGKIDRQTLVKTLQSAKLFCLPSIIEGFGLVTLEAMAAGTPYVNSDISATREITANGQGGLLFQPQNPQDLADKIEELLTNKKLYRQKQHEALALIQHYDWSIVAQRTDELYQEIIKQKYESH